MRRFHFSLSPALRLRRRLEEQAAAVLAETQRSLARQCAQLQELQRELQRHDLCRAGWQRDAVDVGTLLDAERYREALTRVLLLQEERVAAAGAAVDASREALKRRRTDREALERLHERRLAEHRQEELRAEQKSLDEIFEARRRRE